MQRTQGRGTHSSGTGSKNTESWATRRLKARVGSVAVYGAAEAAALQVGDDYAALKRRSSTSLQAFIAALKRCATQNPPIYKQGKSKILVSLLASARANRMASVVGQGRPTHTGNSGMLLRHENY